MEKPKASKPPKRAELAKEIETVLRKHRCDFQPLGDDRSRRQIADECAERLQVLLAGN